ncbi:CotH kinase family protein [Actinomycetaceae bacterium L2_0104]
MTYSSLRSKAFALLAALGLVLAGCAGADAAIDSAASGSSTSDASSNAASGASGSLDSSRVHTVSLTVDDTALRDMLETYAETGDKEWIHASVTVDGETFEDVGIKLKGNSSLRGISADTPAQELPLRIRLDKYVDGQDYNGISDFTVRSNNTETSMNEAVALDLLTEAGLASTQAIATRFSVNGSEESLRLTVQNLDETWVEDYFPDAGQDSVLYKADSEGNWSWLGQDGDYSASFDVEAGDENYQPLIELLDLLNNGTQEEIASQLPEMVDLDSFATYLAFQEIIDNFDDIDGPGNNSYLFWDSATQMFTVVAWDHNLAFGGMAGGEGGMMEGAPGERPEFDGENPPTGQAPNFDDENPPTGQAPNLDNENMPTGERPEFDGDDPAGGGMSRDNPLVTAFESNEEWTALYDSKLADLQTTLIDDGALSDSVDAWSQTLTAGASDLVSAETIAAEGEAINDPGSNGAPTTAESSR